MPSDAFLDEELVIRIMNENIGEKIRSSVVNCPIELSPRNGDCGNIASAIDKYYDSSVIVSLSSSREYNIPEHFAVKINGEIFDGFGRTSRQELFEEFIGDCSTPTNINKFFYELESVESTDYIVFPDLRDCIIRELQG